MHGGERNGSLAGHFTGGGYLQGNARLAAAAGMIGAWAGGFVPEDMRAGAACREQGGSSPKGIVFADIGTDHAYLPIALCEAGVASRAIAADVREGPLAIAKAHIAKAGLSDRIEPRRSDGLSDIAPGEADVIAVCGMGGELVLDILDSNTETAKAAGFLVLGPQSKVYETRTGLRARGLRIIAEDMVCADGKYYPLIGITAGDTLTEAGGSGGDAALAEDLQEACDRYGPVLLEKRHPVLKAFLQKEEARLMKIAEKATGERRDEMMHQMSVCRRAMDRMADKSWRQAGGAPA